MVIKTKNLAWTNTIFMRKNGRLFNITKDDNWARKLSNDLAFFAWTMILILIISSFFSG